MKINTFKKIRLKLLQISSCEKILIMSLIIASITAYFFLYANALNLEDGIINVKQDGEVIFQLSSEQIVEDGIYDFTFDKGIGHIEVKDKKVRMLPMDRNLCPRSICSETGWIKDSMKAIVCLPNHLVVSVEKDANSKIDEMAF